MAVRGLRQMALVALVTILPLYLDAELGLSEWNRGFHIGLLIAVGLVAKTGSWVFVRPTGDGSRCWCPD